MKAKILNGMDEYYRVIHYFGLDSKRKIIKN